MRRTNLPIPPWIRVLLLTVLVAAPQLGAQQREIPTPEERFQIWSKKHPEQPLQATVSFGRVVPEQQVLQLLERHGLTPVAVFAYAEGVHAMNAIRVPSGGAVVNQARQKITEIAQARLDRMPTTFRQFVDDNPQTAVVGDEKLTGLARSQLAILENNRAAVAAYRGNKPIIYAVQLSGSVSALRAASRDPIVQSLEPGLELESGRVALPDPLPLEGTGGARVPAAVAGLTPAQVYQRMQELAVPRGGGQ